MQRTLNADGSIHGTCPSCEGRGYKSLYPEQGHKECSECSGKGFSVIFDPNAKQEEVAQ